MNSASVSKPACRLLAAMLVSVSLLLTACTETRSDADADASESTAQPTTAPEVDAFGMVMLTPVQIEELKSKALSGDAEAMTRAIDTFVMGIGVPKDEVEAYRLAEKGAAMGMIDAKAALGRALRLNVSGIPNDEARGKELWEEAAAQGNERAVRMLAYDLPQMDRVTRLLEFDRTHGIKDGRTAMRLADDRWTQAYDEKATIDDVNRFLECGRKWSMRAATAEVGSLPAESLINLASIAGIAREKNILGYGTPAEHWKKAADSKATSRHDVPQIAWASASYAERALYGLEVAKNAEEARSYALRATKIDGLVDSSDSRAPLRTAYGTLWNLHVEGADTGFFPDNRRAYGWALLAKSVDEPKAWEESENQKPLDNLEKRLSVEQRRQVQAAVAARKPGEDLDLPEETEGAQALEPKASSGTAFLISDDGFALTNAHVVKQCKAIKDSDGSAGVVVAQDEANDLAALRFGSYQDRAFAELEAGSKLPRVGDRIAVFGFPLTEVLATSGNLTAGEVSATSGLGNNSSMFQVTAPIQPGSSGSPVLSLRGNVAGVISSTASTARLAQATGTLGQNLNFAINIDTVTGFLRANGIPFTEAGDGFFSGGERSVAEVGDEAKQWTIRVTCER
jgi:S1-C subfamily serine protease